MKRRRMRFLRLAKWKILRRIRRNVRHVPYTHPMRVYIRELIDTRNRGALLHAEMCSRDARALHAQ